MPRNPLPSMISFVQKNEQWCAHGWGLENTASTSVKRWVSRFFRNEEKVIKFGYRLDRVRILKKILGGDVAGRSKPK